MITGSGWCGLHECGLGCYRWDNRKLA